jgi:hypothetical protein
MVPPTGAVSTELYGHQPISIRDRSLRPDPWNNASERAFDRLLPDPRESGIKCIVPESASFKTVIS